MNKMVILKYLYEPGWNVICWTALPCCSGTVPGPDQFRSSSIRPWSSLDKDLKWTSIFC